MWYTIIFNRKLKDAHYCLWYEGFESKEEAVKKQEEFKTEGLTAHVFNEEEKTIIIDNQIWENKLFLELQDKYIKLLDTIYEINSFVSNKIYKL